MSSLNTISARWDGFFALTSGLSTMRSSSLKATPPSRPRVLDASRADNSGNRNDVEDEGPMLEVTPMLRVTFLLTQRAEEKIDAIFGTWVLEST